jgi:hypothetical protein
MPGADALMSAPKPWRAKPVKPPIPTGTQLKLGPGKRKSRYARKRQQVRELKAELQRRDLESNLLRGLADVDRLLEARPHR